MNKIVLSLIALLLLAQCESTPSSNQSGIQKASATCDAIGFERGTDSYKNCVMNTLNTERSRNVNVTDSARDSRIMMDRGMRMLRGGCTLGVNC